MCILASLQTASGLVVAIFTLLFANTFRGLYQRQIPYIQEYDGQLNYSTVAAMKEEINHTCLPNEVELANCKLVASNWD